MTTSVSLQSEKGSAMSIPVLKELSTKVETMRRMLEKVTGPQDLKKRIKDLATEALNLIEISIREDDLQTTSDASARNTQQMEATIQSLLDKTLDRLMQVERRASTAEAENRLIKDECERLAGHLKQQEQLLENTQRLYKEARDCSDRNATSAKEWRARAHELEAEIANKRGASDDQEKVMQRLRALYIRYTELAASMKEREAEYKVREDMHKAELSGQKSLADERIKILEHEIAGLKRQIDLLKRLERPPADQDATKQQEARVQPQSLPNSYGNEHSLREDSDIAPRTLFVRKPFARTDLSQPVNTTADSLDLGMSSVALDLDAQTMQQIQATMDKNYPMSRIVSATKRTRSTDSTKRWKDVAGSEIADVSTQSERKHVRKSRDASRQPQGRYERPEHIQALLKSTSIYDLIEPSTNTTRVMPSESSVQDHDGVELTLPISSMQLKESQPIDDIDLKKSKTYAALADLLQNFRQTEEGMMASKT